MKRMERPTSNAEEMGDIEAQVARARLSFEEGLREASRVGTRVGLAGGALLLLALVRLARRPASDGALIRIVVETPRPPKYILPVVGGAVARWLFERQLRERSPLGAFLSAMADPRAAREPGKRGLESNRGLGRFES